MKNTYTYTYPILTKFNVDMVQLKEDIFNAVACYLYDFHDIENPPEKLLTKIVIDVSQNILDSYLNK